jgi:perosamine synthetase
MKYPIYMPEITATEKKYVNDCLDSTWISSRGEYLNLFEDKVAEFIGIKHAIAVSNGTVALHLALLVHNIGEGDEVIVPDLTYIATANSVLYVNAKPIIVDVDPYSWNITLESIKNNVTSETKAIIVADIYGAPPEMDEILSFARDNKIIIIEDAAESIGATYKNKMAGNLGDIGTFSFFGNKTITTGEGGMVLTNNFEIAKRLRVLRNQGNSDNVRYYHEILGYNYRMTNIQAAIGYAQISRIRIILEKKREIYKTYFKYLNSEVEFQKVSNYINSSHWMVSFLVKNKFIRDGLIAFLSEEGIETRPFFWPICSMPYYNFQNNPITKKLSNCGINVPSYHTLTKIDIGIICQKIKLYLREIK